jgi:hypothetical protein
MKTVLLIAFVAAVTLPQLAAADETVVSSLEFGAAALKDRPSQHDKDVARQLSNMAVLIRQVQKDAAVPLPPNDQAALARVKQKATDMGVEQIASLMTRILKKGLGVAGEAIAKIFTSTTTSPCADLPSCTGSTTKPDCARRFTMDTDPAQFVKFVGKNGCATALWSALSK